MNGRIFLVVLCVVSASQIDPRKPSNVLNPAFLETKQWDVPLYAYSYLQHGYPGTDQHSTTEVFYGMNSTDWVTKFNNARADGWRPYDVDAYVTNGQTYFNSIWKKGPDYVLGAQGATCTATCALSGRQCNPNIVTNNSPAIFAQLGVKCTNDTRNWWANDQPAYVSAPSDANYGRCLGWNNVPTSVNCDGSYPTTQRVCHCQNWAWASASNQNPQQYQATFNSLTSQGFRPIKVRCYPCGNTVCHIFIFDKSPAPGNWQANHVIASENYQSYFDNMKNNGWVINDLSGCQAGSGEVYYTAIWYQMSHPGWASWNADDIWTMQDTRFQTYYATQWTLSHVNLYRINGQATWATIWTEIPQGQYSWLYYAPTNLLQYALNWQSTGAEFLIVTGC